eukprot:g11927.t1
MILLRIPRLCFDYVWSESEDGFLKLLLLLAVKCYELYSGNAMNCAAARLLLLLAVVAGFCQTCVSRVTAVLFSFFYKPNDSMRITIILAYCINISDSSDELIDGRLCLPYISLQYRGYESGRRGKPKFSRC